MLVIGTVTILEEAWLGYRESNQSLWSVILSIRLFSSPFPLRQQDNE
jgi:hypothetical protein